MASFPTALCTTNFSPNAMTDAPLPPQEDDEDSFLDLRYISAHQIACPGTDLEDMLNCDDAVGEDLYHRLNLTPHVDTSCDFDWLVFDEIRGDAFYMITFPEGTDFSDFSIAQALKVEEIAETCFNNLQSCEDDESCDGECDSCPQECIGKVPVV